MAAILSHVIAGAGIAAALRPHPRPPVRYWLLAIFCAVVPDLDIVLVWMGANYLGMFGHRGFMHSIAFATVLAAILAYEIFRSPPWRDFRFCIWLAFLIAGLSHGILDAMMSAGKGVAFFAPFSPARFHLPVRPIRVSPPSSYIFLREGGIRVSSSEIAWIWVPAVLLAASALWLRWRSKRIIIAA
jgi:inner membrane protein